MISGKVSPASILAAAKIFFSWKSRSKASENINSKINEIKFKEIIEEPKSYALDSYEELINFLKRKVDNRYAKLFNY